MILKNVMPLFVLTVSATINVLAMEEHISQNVGVNPGKQSYEFDSFAIKTWDTEPYFTQFSVMTCPGKSYLMLSTTDYLRWYDDRGKYLGHYWSGSHNNMAADPAPTYVTTARIDCYPNEHGLEEYFLYFNLHHNEDVGGDPAWRYRTSKQTDALSTFENVVAMSIIDNPTASGYKNSTIALGYKNGDIRIFNEKLQTDPTTVSTYLGTHGSPITCLVPLGNNLLASGSEDGVVKIWHLSLQSCLRTAELNESVISALRLKDNTIVVATKNSIISMPSVEEGSFSISAFFLDNQESPIYVDNAVALAKFNDNSIMYFAHKAVDSLTVCNPATDTKHIVHLDIPTFGNLDKIFLTTMNGKIVVALYDEHDKYSYGVYVSKEHVY